jgi:PAS domain S-box-containing protein
VQDTTDYAIFMLDPTGHVASWNAGAERIKGYYADEIIGKHFSVFYPRQDLAAGRPAQNLQTALLSGRVEDEGWRVRKDGTRFWANIVITALYDERRRLRGFGKVTRDATERREAERALRDWARQLQAQQAEQRRMGQELRDGTVQELSSIALLQEVLAGQLDESEAAQLRGLTERLSHSVEELTAYANRLYPPDGDSQLQPELDAAAAQLAATIED